MKTDQRAGEGNKSIMRTHLRVREYTEDRYTSVYLICKIVFDGYLVNNEKEGGRGLNGNVRLK